MPSEIKTENLQLNQWQGNEYLKREDLNEDNKKIDDAFGEVNEKIKANADNIEVLQGRKNIIIKDVIIPTTSCETVSEGNKIVYRVRINDKDISENDVVDFNVSVADLVIGKCDYLLSVTLSFNGYVFVYFKEKPTETIKATMIIQKGV